MKTLSRICDIFVNIIVVGVIAMTVFGVYAIMPEYDSCENIVVATPEPTEVCVPTVIPTATMTPFPVTTLEPTVAPTATPVPTTPPAWSFEVRVDGEKGLPVFNNQSYDLIEIIKECKRYYAENEFSYCMCSGKRKIPADLSWRSSCDDGHSTKSAYRTDCSTLVSWVLYEYAKINDIPDMEEHFSRQKSSGKMRNLGDERGGEWFDIIPSLEKAMPGDILVYYGHVEFFAELCDDGIPMVWSCGNEGSVSNAGVIKSTHKLDRLKYILRLKESL